MTMPRFSIRALTFAVLIVAADCAVLRFLDHLSGSGLGLLFGLYGSLPMAHAVAIVGYQLATRPDSRRPFLIGFALAGLVSILALFQLSLKADDLTLFSLNHWLNGIAAGSPLANGRLSPTSSASETLGYLVTYFTVLASLTALPQFLCCLLGGWLGCGIAASLQPSTTQEGQADASPP